MQYKPARKFTLAIAVLDFWAMSEVDTDLARSVAKFVTNEISVRRWQGFLPFMGKPEIDLVFDCDDIIWNGV